MFEHFYLMFVLIVLTIAYKYFWAALLNGAFLIAFNFESETKSRKLFILVGLISFIPLAAYFLTPVILDKNLQIQTSEMPLKIWIGLAVLSWGLSFWWLRSGVQKFNVLANKLTARTTLERNKKTDIRDMDKYLPAAIKFNPEFYFDKSKGIFLGLDEEKKPVYIEWGDGASAPHVEVVGTTGAGKGISLGVMASQFLQRGEAVFFCDPKNDEWAPSVMFDAAKRMEKPYHYINLNRPNGAQFNLFKGATVDEAFELFQAGFGLTEKGDASDFYGIADRREAGYTAKLMAEDNLTIAEVYAARLDVINNPDSGAEKFFGKLREMAETPSINASADAGIDLAQVIEDGGCVYIVGSMRNDIVKTAQRILLVRLIQLAERRDRMAGVELRKICIVLDEVKYHLSRPALEGLGAARDKGVHLVLAHQSLGDLKDCTKDLNPDAVVDAVVENCRIKICYKVQNPVTAEWLASMSGEAQVDDESQHIQRNIAHSETVDGDRTIRQASRYYMDMNMLLSLKNNVSIVYGAAQLAKFVSIQPLKVPKSRDAVRITVCDGGAVQSAASQFADLPPLD
jgi:hypothetical protein